MATQFAMFHARKHSNNYYCNERVYSLFHESFIQRVFCSTRLQCHVTHLHQRLWLCHQVMKMYPSPQLTRLTRKTGKKIWIWWRELFASKLVSGARWWWWWWWCYNCCSWHHKFVFHTVVRGHNSRPGLLQFMFCDYITTRFFSSKSSSENPNDELINKFLELGHYASHFPLQSNQGLWISLFLQQFECQLSGQQGR